MEVWYHRTETSRGEKCDYDEVTVVFLPDLFYRAPSIPAMIRPAARDRKLVKKTAETPAEKEPRSDIVEVGEIVRPKGETGETGETHGEAKMETKEAKVETGETKMETEEAKVEPEEPKVETGEPKVETMETEGGEEEKSGMESAESEKPEKPEAAWSEAFLKSQTVPTLRQLLRERALSTRVAMGVGTEA